MAYPKYGMTAGVHPCRVARRANTSRIPVSVRYATATAVRRDLLNAALGEGISTCYSVARTPPHIELTSPGDADVRQPTASRAALSLLWLRQGRWCTLVLSQLQGRIEAPTDLWWCSAVRKGGGDLYGRLVGHC